MASMDEKRIYNMAKQLQAQGLTWVVAKNKVKDLLAMEGIDMSSYHIGIIKEAFKTTAYAIFPVMVKAKDGSVSPKAGDLDNFKYLVTRLAFEGQETSYHYNELTKKTHINKPEGAIINDQFINRLYTLACHHGLLRDKNIITSAIDMVAQHYHPVKEKIAAKVWDGVDRITQLFSWLVIVPEATPQMITFYREVYFRRFFGAMVRKIYVPGTENSVLTLLGPQGSGKSRFFTELGKRIYDEGFTDATIDPSSPTSLAYHVDSILHHIAEVDGITSKRDSAELKDYLNKSRVTFRRPYNKYSESGDSIVSFCATLNTQLFLRDITGARRWLVIPITRIKEDWDNFDIQQFLAQMYQQYVVEDSRTWFDDAEVAQTNILNKAYYVENNLHEGVVGEFVKPGATALTLKEILDRVGIEADRVTGPLIEKLTAVILANGVKRVNHSGRVKYKVDIDTIKKASKNAVLFLSDKGLSAKGDEDETH